MVPLRQACCRMRMRASGSSLQCFLEGRSQHSGSPPWGLPASPSIRPSFASADWPLWTLFGLQGTSRASQSQGVRARGRAGARPRLGSGTALVALQCAAPQRGLQKCAQPRPSPWAMSPLPSSQLNWLWECVCVGGGVLGVPVA